MSERCEGAGMVEVLVALLVLSVGFLGIAGLQVAAKRSNHEAMQRTSALVLVRDLSERMRANPVGLGGYLNSGLGGGSLAEPAAGCSRARPCSPGEMAARDLHEWERMLDGTGGEVDGGGANSNGLVNPRACISGPPGGGAGRYRITVVWRGLSALSVSEEDDRCGMGQGLYGEEDALRRVLSLALFIAP